MKKTNKHIARYLRRLWAALLNKPRLLSDEELRFRAKQHSRVKEWMQELGIDPNEVK